MQADAVTHQARREHVASAVRRLQAVQLDYLPRVRILHTSGEHHGQVYVPLVNWCLMIGSIGLVIGFGSSTPTHRPGRGAPRSRT